MNLSVRTRLARSLAALAVSLVLCAETVAVSPPSPCVAAMQRGLYQEYSFTNTDNFASDFKKYLKSDSFTNDVRNKKWRLTGNTVLDGLPVGGAFGFDSGKQQQFRDHVEQMTDEQIVRFAQTLVTYSAPNVDAMKAFNECLHGGVGVSLESMGDTTLVFSVNYWTSHSGDWPVLKAVIPVNATLQQTTLPFGQRMTGPFTITINRADKTQDVSVVVETDYGVVRGDADGEKPEVAPDVLIQPLASWTALLADIYKWRNRGYAPTGLNYDAGKKIILVPLVQSAGPIDVISVMTKNQLGPWGTNKGYRVHAFRVGEWRYAIGVKLPPVAAIDSP